MFMFSTACVMAGPRTQSVDLDGDGRVEEVQIDSTGITVVGGKMQGKFPLPEGVVVSSDEKSDTAIRFVDLNRDGLADLLFANDTSQAIYLWTKKARTDLGWMPGWSQKVRVGARGKSALDLPLLAGSNVSVKDGALIVRDAGGMEAKFDCRALIAVPMPAPLGPEAALKTLRLPEGFRAELVAHEPQISDPVAFDWSADGRLWVVQMNDYPTGLDGHGQLCENPL